MNRTHTFSAIGLLSAALLGCSQDDGLGPAPVGEDVMRDGPIDRPARVEGDGRRAFVSTGALADESLSPYRQLSFPGNVPAPAAIDNGRVYGLSSYAGLVITDAADAVPTRVEARYPLTGAPFEISVRDGVILAIVNEDRALSCLTPLDCQDGQEGHLLLIDARTPTAPQLLAERWVPGAITQTYRRADTLYTLSRVIHPCIPGSECLGVTDFTATITAIDLTDPLALGERGQLPISSEQGVLRAYLFAGPRMYVASGGTSSGSGVQVVELDGELRLGPSAAVDRLFPLEGSLSEQGGILHVTPMRELGFEQPALQFRVTPDALIPIEPVVYPGLAGETVAPVFHGADAFAIAGDQRTLLSFDISDRLAPVLIGSVALPFATTRLLGLGEGQIAAFGSVDGNGDELGTVHVASIDVQAPSAPVVLSQVSWGENRRLGAPARYDAATGLLLVPHLPGSGGGSFQIVATAGGTLELLNNIPAAGGADVVTSSRLIRMRQATLETFPIASGEDTRLEIARPAGFVRVLGDRIARFDDLTNSQLSLLPLDGADLVMDPGTRIEPAERLLPWALERDGHLLVAEQPDAASRGLAIHSFDLSAPGTPALEASAFVEPEPSMVRYAAVGHTNGSVLAQREDGSYDIIDIRTPGAPRVAARFDLPDGMDGFGVFPRMASLDTDWGWHEWALVVTEDILASQHTEVEADGTRALYLDRLDVSAPDAPILLPKVNIPGELLTFDAATGAMATLDTHRFRERLQDCQAVGYRGVYDVDVKACKFLRRGISALVLDGDQAVRTSQILLDVDRRTVALAISGPDIFYVTEPNLSSDDLSDAQNRFADNSDIPVSLEHLRLGPDGFQRLPSIDLTGRHTTLPRTWQLYARDGRVYTISGQELTAIDTRNDTPTITQRILPTWGCPTLDVKNDIAYCAREDAGLEAIDLTAP